MSCVHWVVSVCANYVHTNLLYFNATISFSKYLHIQLYNCCGHSLTGHADCISAFKFPGRKNFWKKSAVNDSVDRD